MSVFEVIQTDREPELSVNYDDVDALKQQLYSQESQEKGSEVYINMEIEWLFDDFTEVAKWLNDKIKDTFDVTLMDDWEVNFKQEKLETELKHIASVLNMKLQKFARSQERNYTDIADELESHATSSVLQIVKSLDPSDKSMSNVDNIWHWVENKNNIAAQPERNVLAEMVGKWERWRAIDEIFKNEKQ